jgi:hypothetical protein
MAAVAMLLPIAATTVTTGNRRSGSGSATVALSSTVPPPRPGAEAPAVGAPTKTWASMSVFVWRSTTARAAGGAWCGATAHQPCGGRCAWPTRTHKASRPLSTKQGASRAGAPSRATHTAARRRRSPSGAAGGVSASQSRATGCASSAAPACVGPRAPDRRSMPAYRSAGADADGRVCGGMAAAGRRCVLTCIGTNGGGGALGRACVCLVARSGRTAERVSPLIRFTGPKARPRLVGARAGAACARLAGWGCVVRAAPDGARCCVMLFGGFFYVLRQKRWTTGLHDQLRARGGEEQG